MDHAMAIGTKHREISRDVILNGHPFFERTDGFEMMRFNKACSGSVQFESASLRRRQGTCNCVDVSVQDVKPLAPTEPSGHKGLASAASTAQGPFLADFCNSIGQNQT